jgi:hypothetical protein
MAIKHVYSLMKGRKYREGSVRYVGPCCVESRYDDLEKRFPGSFIKREVSSFKRAEPKEQTNTPFEMVHKGGGRYIVVRAGTEERLNDDWLTKDEAEKICGKSE